MQAVAALVHVFALALAGGDWMSLYRLFVPVLPSVILVGAELAQRSSRFASAVRLALALGASAVLAISLGPSARGVLAQRRELIEGARPLLAGARRVAALDVLPDIVNVPGLDAVFIGRGDLSIALGVDSPAAPPVVAATERIAAAARQAGRALCAHVDRIDSPDVAWLRSLGVSAFIVASDQGLMRRAALQTLEAFRALGR